MATLEQQVEDESFPYGGYWRGTLADLIEGDGIRLSALHPAQLVVTATPRTDDTGRPVVDLILADRRAWVARTFADALHRPLEGMADDPGVEAATWPADTTVWVRL